MVLMTHNEIVQLRKNLKAIEFEYWFENVFLQWEWWLLLFLVFLPWIIWWFVVDKKRIDEILFFGLVIIILATILDSIGSNLFWWSYPTELIQIIPPLVPVDLSVIPCLMMVVYQYFSTWKRLWLSTLILGILATYIGEAFFIWIGYFQRIEWQHIHSILFYIISGSIAKWIVDKAKYISRNQ